MKRIKLKTLSTNVCRFVTKSVVYLSHDSGSLNCKYIEISSIEISLHCYIKISMYQKLTIDISKYCYFDISTMQ